MEEPLTAHAQIWEYGRAFYPLLIAIGMIQVADGIFSWAYWELHRRFWKMMICSIEVRSDDETFKWVRKYMKEKGLMEETSVLKVQKKRPDLLNWREWVRMM